jgi:hypothetical protein
MTFSYAHLFLKVDISRIEDLELLIVECFPFGVGNSGRKYHSSGGFLLHELVMPGRTTVCQHSPITANVAVCGKKNPTDYNNSEIPNSKGSLLPEHMKKFNMKTSLKLRK